MIQRIQSIYLLIAAISSGLLFAGPFDFFYSDAASTTSSYFTDKVFDIYDNNGLLIGSALLTLIALLAIFLYKKRKLQINLTLVGIGLAIGLVSLIAVGWYSISSNSSLSLSPSIGLVLPIISLIFIIMSKSAIQKDDKLVKSMDRLR